MRNSTASAPGLLRLPVPPVAHALRRTGGGSSCRRHGSVRNAAAAGLLWLLLAAAPCPAFPPVADLTHTKVTGDLVNVDIGFGEYNSDVPLNALTHTLASYPQAHRFRVSWIILMGLSGLNQTAIYDRRKHSVTAYATYTEGANNGLTSFVEHVRYTNVREKDFAKIAAAHRGSASDWNWCDDLPKYGCRRHNLGH